MKVFHFFTESDNIQAFLCSANSLEAITIPPKPPHFAPWDMSCDFELIELGTVDKERQAVCESFYKTVDKSKVQMKLVYRIQNRKLHKEYET